MSRVLSIYVEANFKLFPTIQGGRLTGIRSGYRPNHVFEYVEGQILTTYIGEIQFDENELIQPGEEMIVQIKFLYVPQLEKYLAVGTKWWIHEASKVVGQAEIIKVKHQGE